MEFDNNRLWMTNENLKYLRNDCDVSESENVIVVVTAWMGTSGCVCV